MDQEYFVLVYENDDLLPRLTWDEQTYLIQGENFDYGIFHEAGPLYVPFNLHLTVAQPAPPEPVLADFHRLRSPVISQRVASEFFLLSLYGLQMFKASIRLPNGIIDPNYFCMHIFNEIECLDRNRASFEEDLGAFYIKKIRLDENVLSNIDLPSRLIFALSESSSKLILHRLVVNKLSSLKLRGARFIPILDWHSGSLFDQ